MRIDLNEIQHWIKQGSRILDLGCGDGTLLKFLNDNKQTVTVWKSMQRKLIFASIKA
jgi:cyclopropane fatty-acyl-phospholipid synthase-like methyltransferase